MVLYTKSEAVNPPNNWPPNNWPYSYVQKCARVYWGLEIGLWLATCGFSAAVPNYAALDFQDLS